MGGNEFPCELWHIFILPFFCWRAGVKAKQSKVREKNQHRDPASWGDTLYHVHSIPHNL